MCPSQPPIIVEKRPSHIVGRDSRLMENPHPAQESLRDAVGAFLGSIRFTTNPWGSGGLDARPSASSAVAETGGLGWRASGQHPLRHTMAGCLDCRWASCKIISFRRAPGMVETRLSFMRRIIFELQPPKQPLAQNKNGSRFGRLASY